MQGKTLKYVCLWGIYKSCIKLYFQKQALVELGANIESKDYRGRTPLLLAAELDRSVAASILLDMGASAKV